MARRVTREEGLLIGGSGGTAVAAALEVGRELGPERPGGRADPRLGPGLPVAGVRRRLDGRLRLPARATGRTVGRRARRPRAATSRRSCTSTPTDTVREAVDLMREHGVSQLPVAKGEMPLAAAEVMGAVDELRADGPRLPRPGVLDAPVEEVMGPRAADRSASASRSSSRSSCSTRRPPCWCSPAAGPHAVLSPHRRARASCRGGVTGEPA